MDLSKTFDCFRHHLRIAKLAASGFDNLSKNCLKINNMKSDLTNIVSGVPQVSIAAQILFNIFLNNVFFFLYLASLYNFADDNTSSSFAKSIDILVKILELKNDFAKAWFCFVKKLNLGEIYIIKQSNSDLRVNFMNRTIANYSCDTDKGHLIYFNSYGKPK